MSDVVGRNVQTSRTSQQTEIDKDSTIKEYRMGIDRSSVSDVGGWNIWGKSVS